MKIINKVNDKGYIQWIEQFVEEVISQSDLKCKKVIIDDIEYSRRVYLIIDDMEYIIRTWSFNPVQKDENGMPCAESVRYTLFEMVEDDKGSHGNEICNGVIRIDWKN